MRRPRIMTPAVAAWRRTGAFFWVPATLSLRRELCTSPREFPIQGPPRRAVDPAGEGFDVPALAVPGRRFHEREV